jgi:hypothetical protein
MRVIRKLYFIHEGKAAYPEIAAYKAFFQNRFDVQEITPTELKHCVDLDSSVCWYIMGFYNTRPRSAIVVHDYRSLSIGRLWYIKDSFKRYFNAKPDIRIFQNEDMMKVLGFNRDVPTALLPMGVPDFVLRYRAKTEMSPSSDFCYIGVMSMERRSYLMFDSFLARFGSTRSLHLYGVPELEIQKRYESNPNIVFCGRKTQEEVFDALCKTRVAVNYFPVHNPHKLQTPTKFLEYAALGLRVLSNEHPQSRRAAQTYGLKTLWGSCNDMFAYVPDSLDWDDNRGFDPEPILWPKIIDASGIERLIDAEINRLNIFSFFYSS